jgi:hypothetical protein
MNLRWFHALLILLSAALAVLFGVWSLDQYGREDGVALVAAVAAFATLGRSLRLVVLRRTRTRDDPPAAPSANGETSPPRVVGWQSS